MKSRIKKFVIVLHQKKVDKAVKEKIKIIKRNCNQEEVPYEIKQKYTNLWTPFIKKPSIDFLNCVSEISGITSANYVPENIQYNFIEPVLNSRPFALAYNDKNFFEKLLPHHESLFPDTIVRGINGTFYDKKFIYLYESGITTVLKNLPDNSSLVLKPATETGGGDNITFITKKDKNFIINRRDTVSLDGLVNIIKHQYAGNFALQHKIIQHDYFSRFNESSLNTVRLYTYRSVKDESINPLHAYIRFGKSGSFVDSSSQGGRTCGVFMDGKLNNFAIGKLGEKYLDLEWVNDKKSKLVPKFLSMKQLAIEIAPMFKYHRLLGFDFTLDKDDNVRLLEVNNLYIGVINQQMNTGPLFGEFTEEIVEHCLKHKKTYNIHFYL